MIEKPFIVQRWSQYKLCNSPFKHDKDADIGFDTEDEALNYVIEADSGIGGDTRYRYTVVER